MTKDIIAKVRALSEVKAKIAALNERKKELEAFFLSRGGEDVDNTKYKSAVYTDPDSQASVTYTQARNLSVAAPNYLKKSLGDVFEDIFDVKTTTEIKPRTKDIERMLEGMYTGEFAQLTPEEVVEQLPCDDNIKAALAKKLKGKNFESDRDNLIKLGGFSAADASDYAYMFAESVVWRTFCDVCEMSGITHAQLQRDISLALAVGDTTKITVT